jgi:hypothetical protein
MSNATPRIGFWGALPVPAMPALPAGWICAACGASWSPMIPGCMRCNGQGNRASNPLVDIVISPPAQDEGR